MHDNPSFRECSTEGQPVQSIAVEAQGMVHKAAGNVAGLTIKGQQRAAARALGYPDGNWRLRAAWYGEASCWSAQAFEDLRARFRAWEARQEAKALALDATHAALLRAGATALEGTGEEDDRQDARRMRAAALGMGAALARD